MPFLTIPDEVLSEAGFDQRSFMVELACWLYAAERLSFSSAAKVADLDRTEFEAMLIDRGLPVHRIGPEYLTEELAALHHVERARPAL